MAPLPFGSHAAALVDAMVPSWAWTQVTPKEDRILGTVESMAVVSALYLVVIGVSSFLMRHRRSAKAEDARPLAVADWLAKPHNVIMSLYSLYALVGVSASLWANIAVVVESKSGWSWSLLWSDPKHLLSGGSHMDFWLYTFFLSKYVEWIDSLLLVAKAKPLFPPRAAQYVLHVFHHTVTGSIAYAAWKLQFSAVWIGPVTNCFVHWVMYGYWFCVSVKWVDRSNGWIVTRLQLIQFVICMLIVAPDLVYPEKSGANSVAVYWIYFCYVVFLALFSKLFMDKLALKKAHTADEKKRK